MLLCFLLGTQGHPYSLSGFFGNAIDQTILGVNHIYKGEGVPFDPEGLISTLPAIVQVIFGFLVGEYIQAKGKSFEMLAQLLLAGVILVLAGYIWDFSFPINKKIWIVSKNTTTNTSNVYMLELLSYSCNINEINDFINNFFAFLKEE